MNDNCGCGCENNCGVSYSNNRCGNGMSSCLWIILLLIFCGGGCGNNGSGLFGGRSDDCGCGCGNDSCMWIILLLIFCGGCGNGCC